MDTTAGAQRLVIHAHGPTDDLRRARFGSTAPLSHPDRLQDPPEPAARWVCGPEPACQQTLRLWGIPPAPVPELANPGFGRWEGRTLEDVAGADRHQLSDWMRSPAHPPPGGESLTALLDRLHGFLAGLTGPRWGVVVTPLVGRALVVAALRAPASLVNSIEISPAGRAHLSRQSQQGSWRLRQLH